MWELLLIALAASVLIADINMAHSKPAAVLGDQPTIVQSMQSSEARTRSQKAKLAKSPVGMEMEGGQAEGNIVSQDDLYTTIQRTQTTLANVDSKLDILTKMQSEFNSLKKSNALLKKEARNARFKVNVLTNVVIRLEEKLDLQADKMIQMQARSMRKNIVISGFDEPQKPQVETSYSLMQALQVFFRAKLGVQEDIPIKVCHRFGAPDGSGVRPVVVKLQSVEDKFSLLAKGPRLKDAVNSNGKRYYISEQLPDKLQEERRYNQHWVQENKHDPTSKLEMKIFKNKLRINNEPYKKKVKTPNAAEILRLDDNELLSVKQVALYEGGTREEKGSEFLAFAAKCQSAEDVRQAYRKLKIKYADASHITSAHRLSPPNGPYNQEAMDDGEHGMGRVLLKLLQEQKVTNVAVFVLRYYGGTHIGSARFDIARQLATKAIKAAGLKNASPSRSRLNPVKLNQNEHSSGTNDQSQSDSEPEVVRQFRGGFLNPNHSTAGDIEEDEEGASQIAGSEMSQTDEAVSQDEDSDYDETRSQLSNEHAPEFEQWNSDEVPPLESTQEQNLHLDRVVAMKIKCTEQSDAHAAT